MGGEKESERVRAGYRQRGEGMGVRRENKQSKCFAFHQSPAVLSFMSPSVQCLSRSPHCLAIDFHITLFYAFIYFIYFFLNIIDEPQEDRRGASSDVNSQFQPYPLL